MSPFKKAQKILCLFMLLCDMRRPPCVNEYMQRSIILPPLYSIYAVTFFPRWCYLHPTSSYLARAGAICNMPWACELDVAICTLPTSSIERGASVAQPRMILAGCRRLCYQHLPVCTMLAWPYLEWKRELVFWGEYSVRIGSPVDKRCWRFTLLLQKLSCRADLWSRGMVTRVTGSAKTVQLGVICTNIPACQL